MSQSEPWTIGRLLTWTTDYLKQHGSDSPRLDAEVLLAEARGCKRIELYTAFAEDADEPTRTAFRELVRREPNFPEGHNNLGLMLLQSGAAAGAHAQFAEAIRLKPEYAEAHYNLALALHQEGKEDAAHAEFEKAYAISPELRNAPHP